MAKKFLVLQEPITKISNVNLGQPCTLEAPLGKNIHAIIVGLTVTASATGAATKTVPRPSWGAGYLDFKLGNVNRHRRAQDLFGVGGLNALNDRKMAGTVQYTQAGALITATSNGRTVGNEPVLIDSAEDVALQAALANNTATIATFQLPMIFAENWRVDPDWTGPALGLKTGFDDGTVLGTPYLLVNVPATTGVAGTMTAVAITGSMLYTEDLAPKGSVINMVKHKEHQKTYDVGNIEVGDQFDSKDVLQRFSLLTATDKITRVVVKRGSRVLRDVSFAENQCASFISMGNGEACRYNRFDVDLDLEDDPETALPLARVPGLSIVATFATANDNPKNCLILAEYYGPVE